MKVTGVTTPIMNQVPTWKSIKPVRTASKLTDRLRDRRRRWKMTKSKDWRVVIKMAGTRKAQIEIQ
jgi:hypothetical protein